MAYQQGDLVVHLNFGVGTILCVETKNPGGDPCLYYRVGFDNTTVWIPVDQNRTDRIRPVTPKTELERYRQLLRSNPESLEGDFRTRQTALLQKLSTGTYESICQVVRDLTAYQSTKSLTQFEKKMLVNAHSALVSEWSISSGLSLDQARSEIDLCLAV